MECPRCKKTVGLRPGVFLGCVNNGCIARMWNYVGCASCDYMWSFSLQPEEGGVPSSDPHPAGSRPPSDAQAGAGSAEDPLSLSQVFSELDKFCAAIVSIP